MIGLWKFHCKNGKERSILMIYILHSLMQRPKSGYDMLREIEEKTGGRWKPSKGTLYPLLKSLENEGLIKVTKTDARSKSIFGLTAEGKNILRHMQKHRDESRKKFLMFRELFLDVLGKRTEIERLLLEIRESAYEKSRKSRQKTLSVLRRCLSELEKVR